MHACILSLILSLITALPPDLTPSSGLRFGTRRETYLEFNKKLRIKRRANFGVEFKTTTRNGIIFYIGDDKNNDFITLFVKNGLVSNIFLFSYNFFKLVFLEIFYSLEK